MQKDKKKQCRNPAPAMDANRNVQTAIQTVNSQAKKKHDRKGRRKPKRPTGLPVSLKGLQQVSHGLGFHQALHPERMKGLTWRLRAGDSR
jgi:hypothetical protein